MKYKHGHCKAGQRTKTFSIWVAMKQRCSPKFRLRKYYYDLGIQVCDRWLDYANFLADMGERPGEMTLDRIDNNKGYSPDNCRWATRKEQAVNRKYVVMYEYQGEKKSLHEWGADPRCMVGQHGLYIRVRIQGMDFVSALTTPKRKNQFK